MYQALYRKYRPTRFEDVVGQTAVTQTLRGQIESGHIGHAYLFTGTRGTGKTTCAKIFAKAVNCEHPQNGDPCNECAACRGIGDGSVTDVYEIDAASNNSVGDVRELREDVIYTPASVKYKVYIIDEVHRMSGPAFDALLKTIEEPPAHVIFILATTELHKVPATILSRCQRFDFRRIDTADIAARLSYVAAQEHLDMTEEAALLLARMGRGSMRDALSLLERSAALQGKIDARAVGDLLGLCDPQRLLGCAQSIAEGDSAAVLHFLDDMWRASKDTTRLLGELGTLFRDIMMVHTAPELVSAGHSAEETQQMRDLFDRLGLARVLSILETIQNGMKSLSVGEDERVFTEIILMRLCDPRLSADPAALLARIEKLERNPGEGAPTPQPIPRAAPPKTEKAAGAAVKQPPQQRKTNDTELWSRTLEILKSDGRQDLMGTLSNITPIFQDFKVIFRMEQGFTRMLLSTESNKTALCSALKKVDGGTYHIVFEDPTAAPEQRDALDDLIDTINEGDQI